MGTLIDSVDFHARAWAEAFAKFGRPVGFEKVRGQIGKGGDNLMPVFLSEQQIDAFGEDLEAFRGELFARWPPIDSVEKVCDHGRVGWREFLIAECLNVAQTFEW